MGIHRPLLSPKNQVREGSVVKTKIGRKERNVVLARSEACSLKCHPAMQRNLPPVSLPSACLPFSALLLPHTEVTLTWSPALCRSDTCITLPPPGVLITQVESFSEPLRRLTLVNTTHSRYIAWEGRSHSECLRTLPHAASLLSSCSLNFFIC